MRVPRFDVRTGMTRLQTVTVTKASADQRRGRAGRLGPGGCYRLWTEHEHDTLMLHNTPEILEADLAPLALELAAWGSHASQLTWLDAPPGAAYEQARELLFELGALDDNGSITEHGRRMARVPTHPRIAHMLLRARALDRVSLACDIAALLSERDILRGSQNDPDLRLRLLALRGKRAGDVDRSTLARVKREADHLRRARHARYPDSDDELAGVLLAFAYPDRIAQKRERRGSFLLRNGRGAVIDPAFNIAGEPYVVAADLDGRGADSRIFMAAAIDEQEIREHFGEQIKEAQHVGLVDGKARAHVREHLGAITFSDKPVTNPDPHIIALALLTEVQGRGLDILPWNEAARSLQERVNFMRSLDAAWPDLTDAALKASLMEWLLPMLPGIDAVHKIDVLSALQARVPWELRKHLDELAPTHLQVPTGSQVRIDYSDPRAPSIAVRLQEVFGLVETPRIGGNRVPITMQLLSPAQRPVQVTRDLASFWRSGYFDVKKELKGRYPKHY
ncbi:MAG TPA: ATP-dependent helicase HrpB, partial [Longimicrobiales bacterium]